MERLQKTFAKLILRQEYVNYENALLKLNLDSLASRREAMSLKFANDGIESNTLNDLLIRNRQKSKFREVKQQEIFRVQYANTERLKKSTVIQLQNQLNKKKQ